MRSPKLLFVNLFLFLMVTAKAEKIPFCQALVKIIESSDKEFADIKLSEMKSETLVYKYGSSVEIAEATDSYLKKITSTMTYTSDLGKFTSEEAAKIKLNELTALLKNCFNTIEFVSYVEPLFKTYNVDLKNNGEKGFLYYKAGFRIKKWGGFYELVFEYPAAESAGYGVNNALVPVYSEFYYIDKQQNNAQFSMDIRKLLDEAKTAFVNYKAEEIKSDFSFFTNYRSKFNPSGFSNCYIEDRGMNIINFVIPIATGLTLEQAQKFQEEYLNKLELAFGSNFAVNFSNDGNVVTYVNKMQPQKKLVQIVFSYKSGGYDMNLHIVADR